MKIAKTTRKCTSYCKKILPLTKEYFYKSKNNPYGFDYKCKECTKRKRKENKEYFAKKLKKYQKDNYEKLKNYYNDRYNNNKNYYKTYSKKESVKTKRKIYNKINKNNIAKYQKELRKNNIQYKIRDNLSTRVYTKIIYSKGKKSKTTLELIGCTIEFFKKYMENQFKPEMNWNNWGEIWEMDHIKPCSKFDLTKPEEQQKCFHYTNLQPLFKTTKIAEQMGYNEIGNRNKYNNYIDVSK